jgi:uncharacterized LabA/DUF88 family protein
MQKVSVFVDVQNIYYTTKEKYGCNFNYNAFWNQVVSGRELVNATAYAIDRGDDKQKQFQTILRGIGFEVKLKPYISRKDGSAKGDWDVGITIDIMECAQESDLIVLASGDGDFDLLLQNIRTRHDTASEVYGVRDLTAISLIKSASKFFPIGGALLLK